MKITGKKILVTGGASGIGLAMAERFAQNGNTVIICGRRQDALDAAVSKTPGLISRVCDLAKESERIELFKWISDAHPDLSILVNNAGIQNWMKIDDEDFFKKSSEEIRINIEAPVHLSQLFQAHPSLTTIMNVTSGLAFVPLTKTPVYSATKAFMRSFTTTLRHLLKAKNIEVIEIIPPALNTDLGGKGIHDFAPPVSGFIDSIFEQMEQGRESLTYGFTEQLSSEGKELFSKVFQQVNQVGEKN